MQDEISARMTGLNTSWDELNDMAANRCVNVKTIKVELHDMTASSYVLTSCSRHK